jgi:CheY-like chemotaxis protein
MRTNQRPEDINALYWWVFTWRNFIVALTFVLRAVPTKSRLVKSLFGRMAVFLVLSGICDSVFVYAQTWRGLQFGTWYELLWTIPRVLMIWLATSWVAPKEPEPALKESSSESKERIHLLLTDLILPAMSGLEIAKRLSQLRPEVAVLFMSGYTDDALIHSHGFDETLAFLQKPFSSATLGAKIGEVLEADGFKVPKAP